MKQDKITERREETRLNKINPLSWMSRTEREKINEGKNKKKHVRQTKKACARYGTRILGTGWDVVPSSPKFPVPVFMSYRTHRSVRYRYWCCTENTQVFGTGMKVCTGIHVVSNLPKCPVRVLMSYRKYPCVWCRYWCLTEVIQVSGTGIDVVPTLSNCPVPALMYWTYRSVRYR